MLPSNHSSIGAFVGSGIEAGWWETRSVERLWGGAALARVIMAP